MSTILEDLNSEPEVINNIENCKCCCHVNQQSTNKEENKDTIDRDTTNKDTTDREENKDTTNKEENKDITDKDITDDDTTDKDTTDDDTSDDDNCTNKNTLDNYTSDDEDNINKNTSDDEDNINKNTLDEQTQYKMTPVKNTEIFVTLIDKTPKFYCSSLEEAQEQLITFFKNYPHKKDHTYYTEIKDNKVILSSFYNFFIITYERVESIGEIHQLSCVQFE
jgi:hypothetical protein